MPRTKPLSIEEKKIGLRLRQFRLSTELSLVKFARTIEIDSTLLGSYEHGRNRVSFIAAEKVAQKFGLSLSWLAEGVGEMRSWNYLPEVIGTRLTDRMSFSEAYETIVKVAMAERKRDIAGDNQKARTELIDTISLLHMDLPPVLAANLADEIYRIAKSYRGFVSAIGSPLTKPVRKSKAKS